MTKKSSIALVADAAGITEAQAKKAIKAVFDTVLVDVLGGEKVSVHGFGSFDMKEAKERDGHNPKTGKAIVIPAKKTVRFKFSKATENKINGK